MRHALAPGGGDPSIFTLGECASQRNLDDRGRAQARTTGAAFAERGITFDQVMTSQWCRTKETAELLDSGPVVEMPSLNSFFQDYSTRAAQTAATLDLLNRTEGKLMLVTHQVNISALTGRGTRSGEVLVLRLTEGSTEGPAEGQVEVIGSILIDP
jgi:phosphohistidine phosphatase SixA